jgi:hypothetical protein
VPDSEPNTPAMTPTRLPDGLDPPEPNTGRGFRKRRPEGEYAKINSGKVTVAVAEDENATEFDFEEIILAGIED